MFGRYDTIWGFQWCREWFDYFLNIIFIMIQSYQNDPLLHNYLAPSYPIFIQLKSLIQALATKKSPRNIRPDLLFVTYS